MTQTPENPYSYLSGFLSIAIHICVLLLSGGLLIQSIEFNVQKGQESTEVDLVATLPVLDTPTTTPTEQPDTHVKETHEAIPPTKIPDLKSDVAQPKKTTPPQQKIKAQPTPHQKITKTTHAPHRTSRVQGAKVTIKPAYLSNPSPEYPEIARQAHQEGLVILRVVVNENGRVVGVFVKKSSGFKSLDNAAVTTVKRWVFKPGRRLGIAVKSTVDVPVRFRLGN